MHDCLKSSWIEDIDHLLHVCKDYSLSAYYCSLSAYYFDCCSDLYDLLSSMQEFLDESCYVALPATTQSVWPVQHHMNSLPFKAGCRHLPVRLRRDRCEGAGAVRSNRAAKFDGSDHEMAPEQQSIAWSFIDLRPPGKEILSSWKGREGKSKEWRRTITAKRRSPHSEHGDLSKQLELDASALESSSAGAPTALLRKDPQFKKLCTGRKKSYKRSRRQSVRGGSRRSRLYSTEDDE